MLFSSAAYLNACRYWAGMGQTSFSFATTRAGFSAAATRSGGAPPAFLTSPVVAASAAARTRSAARRPAIKELMLTVPSDVRSLRGWKQRQRAGDERPCELELVGVS